MPEHDTPIDLEPEQPEAQRVEGRQARWIDASRIDVELLHPELGWIPFTAAADDPEPFGREIFAAAAAGEFGPVAQAKE